MRCENVSGRLASSHNQAGAGQLSSICVTAIGGCPWRWLLCTLRHMEQREIDLWHIRRALELARRGQGFVEPNPMVGCVIAQGAEIIGEGWHRRFGQAHAEVEALHIAGDRAAGGTLYVTLEPCCHHGKTPPCTEAVLASGVRRVVVAMRDPFPQVQGGGIAALQAAGLTVEVGLLEDEAARLNAPYLRLVETGRPWIIAKWAMTLDGKIATHTGQSQWISNPKSREIVHALRGRVDALMIGRGTAERDDPLLTARPAGPRTAARVVLDTHASLCSTSQLVRTAGQSPVLVAVGNEATLANCATASRRRLRSVRLRRRDARRPARRFAGRIRPPPLEQCDGGRGRPLAGQPVGCLCDRRGSRFHRAEARRRGVGRHPRRWPRDRRNLRGPMPRIAASAAIGRRRLHHGPIGVGLLAK